MGATYGEMTASGVFADRGKGCVGLQAFYARNILRPPLYAGGAATMPVSGSSNPVQSGGGVGRPGGAAVPPR